MGLSNFPTSLDSITNKTDNVDDVLAAHINLCNDAIEAIEAKLGIDSSAVVTSIEYILKNASSSNPGHKHTLVAGATDVTATAAQINSINKLWTYQNTAPTGWQIVASTTDALLACKGGSNAYNATGGTQVGTWTQPNHTHGVGSYAGPSHTHAGPSHTHSVPRDGWGKGVAPNLGRLLTDAASRLEATGNNTSGAGGTGATGASGTGSVTGTSANGATAAAYRPLANLGITIEKT